MAQPAPAASPAGGLVIDRVFSTPGQHPFDSVTWVSRDAAIKNHTGEAIFEQLGVEFPEAFSPLAVNVVASKYFYGDLARGNGSPAEGQREYSLKQLVHRVTRTITDWGKDQGYFATDADAETFYDELTWLCTNQVGAFNSPVWFNVGLGAQYGVRDSGGKTISGWDFERGEVVDVDPYQRPQASACFIISVEDSVDDIWQLMGESARLFKFGSGVGADWSKLRSSREKLSGGGIPSGPVSFMKVQDATGGTIKSGGKCLAPSTKVYTERGPVAVEELAGREGEWPFLALSYDPPAGRMKVKRARAWQSGVKEVVRVHTDKGHFDLSFDHPVKLASGPFELAGDLRPGQRLFQSTLDPHSAGYVRVSLRDGQKGCELLHRMVAADVLGHDLDGMSVHHRDGDKLNNRPDNLEVVSQAERARLHGEALAEAGEHVFQHAAGDPRFDHDGPDNGMHRSGRFWRDPVRSQAYREAKRAEMEDRGPAKLQTTAVRQRYMNVGWTLLNAGHDISTLDAFFAAYQTEIGRVDSKPRRRAAFDEQFGGYDGFLTELDASNHRVTEVEWLGEMDVYSVEVDCPTADDKSAATGHNFLIWSGDNDTPFGSGVVVSNTRRAAIMQTLKVWHPDILEFVTAKQTEERKAWALIEEGYDGSFNGDAYGSVAFQNVNQSVRLNDAFMEAANRGEAFPLTAVTSGEAVDEVDAQDLLLTIAEGTHVCGDPGAQYEDTIQRWHTCKNHGPINSSNPCVTGDTLVATDDGLRRIDSMLGETPRVVGLDGKLHRTTRVIETGTKPVYRFRTKSGYEIKLTADHRVWTENRGDVPAGELMKGDVVKLMPGRFGVEALADDRAEYVGLMLGDGCVSGGVATLAVNKETEWAVAEKAASVVNGFERGTHRAGVAVTERATSAAVATAAASVTAFLAEYAVLDAGSTGKRLSDRALRLDRASTAALLRGLFTADGTVVDSGDKSQYVGLDSTSEAMLSQVQTLLLSFGIKSKLYRNRRLTDRALLPDGQGGLKDYAVQQMHSLRVTRSGRVAFEEQIGFMAESEKAGALRALNARVSAYADRMTDPVASLDLIGEEPVYDLTEPVTDHFVAGGVAVHNCSEYMFLDDSACNLASLNLMQFKRDDGTFDVERYRAAARIYITAQEILVDNAGYPSPTIARNSHAYRPLGLGFANLGALLMSMGLPYDSDEGRAVAGALMAIEHCEAYARSAEIAANEKIGPFDGYADNAEPMLDVMRMHRDALAEIDASCPGYLREAAQASADRMVALGETHGYRNAQATVLAPTGCLTADAMVLSSEGLLPITELGDPEGETWQTTSLSVVQEEGTESATRFFINGRDRVYRIETARGHQITGTWKHRLRVIDAEGDYVWRRMEDLRPGDVAVLRLGGHADVLADQPLVRLADAPAQDPRDERFSLPDLLDDGTAEVLGYYAGDGYLKARGGLHLVVADTDPDLLDHFGGWAEAIGARPTVEERTGCSVLHVHGRRLYRWMHGNGFAKPTGNAGEGAVGATIPLAVLRSRTSVLAAFLRGLFEADGAVSTNQGGTPVVELTTVSETLARQAQTALESLDIAVSLRAQEAREDQFGSRTKYRVRLASVADCQAFAETVGFVSERKRRVLADALGASTGCTTTGQTLRHPALLDDLYATSEGLPTVVRQDIAVRRYQGKANLAWATRLIDQNPQLQASKLAQYLDMGTLQFVEIVLAEFSGEQETFDLSVPVRNTYVANGFVSHNTIGFMMDCDTTGIEPDLALVKYKLLAGKGDGLMKIVNQTVPEALARLGYTDAEARVILDYIDEHDTIEGAPGLKTEHLAVFDCAFKPHNGERSISHLGHIRMMAACQPFISGAISKTVNLPESATVEDIADAYTQSWELGLKAVAIYRENSKRSQPLSTQSGGNTATARGGGKTEAVELADGASASGDGAAAGTPEIREVETIVEKVVYRPHRERLPDERPSVTHKFSVAGHEGYLHVGLYPEGHRNAGRPGEIFITMAKQGSTIAGLMDSFATAISLAFQYGVPLEDLVSKFGHVRFEPAGFTNNPQIPIAKSITDYIFRYLSLKFLGGGDGGSPDLAEEEVSVDPTRAVAAEADRHGPASDQSQADLFATAQAAIDAGQPSLVGGTTEAALATEPETGELGAFQNQDDAPACPNCGGITVRAGSCYSCPNCGSSTGCG
ncbi:LAGLIDADG family homing endonuclease [Rubrivirga sp.]|uniref:LAGLIDADG family homing endonuclease n=1 Tax=Rubrivirga sp. TaxID=1885344 RepID=UPI003B516D1C